MTPNPSMGPATVGFAPFCGPVISSVRRKNRRVEKDILAG